MTTLAIALVKAQAAAKGVEKDARNQFHKYNYASAEAIIREAKECLTSHGLAVIPRTTSLTTTGAGPDTQHWLIRSWTLQHESGENLVFDQAPWPVVPEKGRPLDKAMAAADTASMGYALRGVLQLPRVEEGTDLDSDDRDRHRNGKDDDYSNGNRDPRDEERGPPERTDAQRKEIEALVARLGITTDIGKYLRSVVDFGDKVPSVSDATKIITILKARVDGKEKADASRPTQPVVASGTEPDRDANTKKPTRTTAGKSAA